MRVGDNTTMRASLVVTLLLIGVDLAACGHDFFGLDPSMQPCPTDYHSHPNYDPDWMPAPPHLGLQKCYKDSSKEWGLNRWQNCKEVCRNGVYCSKEIGPPVTLGRRQLAYCTTSKSLTIESAAEEAWIASEFFNNPNRKSGNGVIYTSPDWPIWTGYGFFDASTRGNGLPTVTAAGDPTGSWAWLSNSPSAMAPSWVNGTEPSDGCASIRGAPDGPDGGWHGVPCGTFLRCICELTPHFPPAPPAPPAPPLAPPPTEPPRAATGALGPIQILIRVGLAVAGVCGIVALIYHLKKEKKLCFKTKLSGSGRHRPIMREGKSAASVSATSAAA